MKRSKKNIFLLVVLLGSVHFCYAQKKSNNTLQLISVKNKDSVNKPAIKNSDSASTPHKKLHAWQANFHTINIDASKLLLNFANRNTQRYELIAERYCKNTNWLSLQLGHSQAKLASQKLSYRSSSTGVLIGLQKSLFPLLNAHDADNAFIGIGYGANYNAMTSAIYTITDAWGSYSAALPASMRLTHHAELNGGFRLRLGKHIVAGWRAQGKVLLNNKSLTSIRPLYIANYGSGDKETVFNYALTLGWKF